jgi:HEAT repeat protein
VKITGKVCATKASESWLKENKKELEAGYCAHKLQKGLADPDPEVREATVEALAKIDDDASFEALESNFKTLDGGLPALRHL